MDQLSSTFDRLSHLLADYGSVQRAAWQYFWDRCHLGDSRGNGSEFPKNYRFDVRG